MKALRIFAVFAIAVAALLALTAPASAIERNFAGSAQLDYHFVPTNRQAKAFPSGFDGFTMEFAGKLAVDFSEKVSANMKVCYGCHGFEADMMYFDFRIADELNFRVGRFSPSFGAFNLRHDPANHRLSDKPLPYVSFGDASKVRVGQPVMAVGNPFGLGGTVTTGIVSARGRDIHSGPFDDYIQTDAAINRGNSGGPLFDMDGNVIGINTAIYSPTGGSIGLGFAIPSSLAQPVVAELKDNGRVERGLLGVQIQPVSKEIAESLSLKSEKGALVAVVQPDSAALAAGVQSGDVIVSVDGKKVDGIKELTRTISAVKPGTSVKLGVWRDGKETTLTAKVGGQKDDAIVKASADGKDGAAKPAPLSYGVSLAPLSPEARKQLGLGGDVKGVVVATVEPGSPADDQGLKAGDVLQQVGKDAVDSPKMAAEKLKEAKTTGKPVLMKVFREGMTRFVAISPRAA